MRFAQRKAQSEKVGGGVGVQCFVLWFVLCGTGCVVRWAAAAAAKRTVVGAVVVAVVVVVNTVVRTVGVGCVWKRQWLLL